jgi:hypothetical protein
MWRRGHSFAMTCYRFVTPQPCQGRFASKAAPLLHYTRQPPTHKCAPRPHHRRGDTFHVSLPSTTPLTHHPGPSLHYARRQKVACVWMIVEYNKARSSKHRGIKRLL